MEENNPSVKKLIELGDRNKKNKDYGKAIHYYNNVLKLDPQNKEANLKLGEIYTLKTEKDNFFYQPAMESYRKIINIDPKNEEIHNKLISLAIKSGQLGDLSIEYREKINKNPDNEILKKCLERIYTGYYLCLNF